MSWDDLNRLHHVSMYVVPLFSHPHNGAVTWTSTGIYVVSKSLKEPNPVTTPSAGQAVRYMPQHGGACSSPSEHSLSVDAAGGVERHNSSAAGSQEGCVEQWCEKYTTNHHVSVD